MVNTKSSDANWSTRCAWRRIAPCGRPTPCHRGSAPSSLARSGVGSRCICPRDYDSADAQRRRPVGAWLPTLADRAPAHRAGDPHAGAKRRSTLSRRRPALSSEKLYSRSVKSFIPYALGRRHFPPNSNRPPGPKRAEKTMRAIIGICTMVIWSRASRIGGKHSQL